jgi:hypothetical protein
MVFFEELKQGDTKDKTFRNQYLQVLNREYSMQNFSEPVTSGLIAAWLE